MRGSEGVNGCAGRGNGCGRRGTGRGSRRGRLLSWKKGSRKSGVGGSGRVGSCRIRIREAGKRGGDGRIRREELVSVRASRGRPGRSCGAGREERGRSLGRIRGRNRGLLRSLRGRSHGHSPVRRRSLREVLLRGKGRRCTRAKRSERAQREKERKNVRRI